MKRSMVEPVNVRRGLGVLALAEELDEFGARMDFGENLRGMAEFERGRSGTPEFFIGGAAVSRAQGLRRAAQACWSPLTAPGFQHRSRRPAAPRAGIRASGNRRRDGLEPGFEGAGQFDGEIAGDVAARGTVDADEDLLIMAAPRS
jgi:hypothetical protein